MGFTEEKAREARQQELAQQSDREQEQQGGRGDESGTDELRSLQQEWNRLYHKTLGSEGLTLDERSRMTAIRHRIRYLKEIHQAAPPPLGRALQILGVLQIIGGAVVAAVLAKAGVVERQTTERVGLSIEMTTETVISWAHIGGAGGVLLSSLAGAVVMFALADVLRRSAATTRELDKIRNLLS